MMHIAPHCPPHHGHQDRHHHAASGAAHAAPALLAFLWLGCIGQPRVSMLPPMNSSSTRGETIRPIEQSIGAPIGAPDRDTSATLAGEDYGASQGKVTLAALLVRLFAGSTAPFMWGMYGLFDEDRGIVARPPYVRSEPNTRPAAAERPRPGCAVFLCGPRLTPRR